MTDMPPSPVPPPAKLDPETLVLRGKPAPVIRFRRGAIIALSATVSTALVALAWLALKPATLSFIGSGDDPSEARTASPPEELAGAPRSYSDVPQLGPPLPGDLGRPILKNQSEAAASAGTPDAAQRAAQEAETERQRLAAERQSARQSGVMMEVATAARSPATPLAETELVISNAQAGAGAGTSANAAPRRDQLIGRFNSDDEVSSHRLVAPISPYMLSAGSIIAASLITGLNSDLPGFVSAQVTENTYDSVTGRTLLIPQGARLIGSYDSVVAFGQSRALVVWQRIIMPDGSSIRIDNVPATDATGSVGLSDRIDRHSWQLAKGVALSTLLGVGTEFSFGSNESDMAGAARESMQQNGARAGDQLVSRNLDVQPTLRVRPGWPLRVVVHKDMILRPWGGARG